MAKGRSQREKRDYVGKIPKQGGGEGGDTQTKLHIFLCFIKWQKNVKIPRLGKGEEGVRHLGIFN